MTGYSAYNARSAVQSPREQEAMAFRLTARTLKEAKGKADRNNALNVHHRVWSGVFREVNSPACALPAVLRNDLMRLSVWAMNYSTRAVLKDLPLDPLVQVNLDMAEGLERTERAPLAPPPILTAAAAPVAAPAWV